MNPFDGVAKFFLGMLEQKTIQNWARLIFELLCSGILSFLFVCGSATLLGDRKRYRHGSGRVVHDGSIPPLTTNERPPARSSESRGLKRTQYRYRSDSKELSGAV